MTSKSKDQQISDAQKYLEVLSHAKAWGVGTLEQPSAAGVEAIDEVMESFADKVGDLRAKYEVQGSLLGGESSLEVAYLEELNKLMDHHRALLFAACMDYVANNESIDLILDALRHGKN